MNNQHNCPKNHPLKYQQVGEDKKVICDKCQREINGFSDVHWHCNICDYDQCYKCGGYPTTKCFCGQQIFQCTKYFYTDYTCDICKRIIKSKGSGCFKHNFDMCGDCRQNK